MVPLPTGTITFLSTDIEGSTKLSQEYPDQWEDRRAKHHAILQTALEAHNGYAFQIIVDVFCVVFHTANDRLNAPIDTQRDLNRIKNNRHSLRSDRTPFAKIKPRQGWKNT